MSSTQGGDGRGTRAPGWYPDPRDPTRHRYWDGARWSELSTTGGAPPDPSGGATPAAAPATRPGRVALVALVGVVVLVAATGVWWLLRGDDQDRAAVATTTTVDRDDPGTAASSTSAVGPDATADGSSTTVGATTAPSTQPADPRPGSTPCQVDADTLLRLLQAHPPLADYADRLSAESPRCADGWASAIVAAPDTDRALALFRREGDGWTLVLLGAAEPCAGLGIPASAESELGCGDW